jgi:hypothetical protein
MPQGIEIVLQTNQWEKLGRELVEKGVSKDFISAEFKSILGKIGTKGKKILQGHTPVHTGFLRAAAGKKADRFPDRMGAYGLVGYLRPNYNKHQFWITMGTKARYTKNGAHRGKIVPKKPDPLQKTKQDLEGPAAETLSKNIESSIERAVLKMNVKYNDNWGPPL